MGLKIRASAAKSWVHCPRRAWFDYNSPTGYETLELNEFDQLVISKGEVHEQNVLKQLAAEAQVVEATSEEHTRALMKEGTPIIYQAELSDGEIVGIPDFLIRDASGQYFPADAKLARREDKTEIQIQLGIYRRLLGNKLKGRVYLGTGELSEIGEEADKDTEKFLTGMREILADRSPAAVCSGSVGNGEGVPPVC